MIEGRPAHRDARLRRLASRLLPGTVLVVSVVFGLLAMHGLGPHSSAAAPAATEWSGVAAGHGGHDTTGSLVTHLGSDVAQAGLQLTSSGPAHHSSGDEHLGVAMACMVLLLIAMAALGPPRLLTGWGRYPSHGQAVPHTADTPAPRPPLLHLLCISRT